MQGCSRLEEGIRGITISLRAVGLFVSDKTVAPDHSHTHLDGIVAGPYSTGDVCHKRCMPQRFDTLAIDRDLGHTRYLSQIETDTSLFHLLAGELQAMGVGGCTCKNSVHLVPKTA